MVSDFTKIETTRLLEMDWNTAVLVNDEDRAKSYQMTIPAKPKEDGTTLGWIFTYGTPSREAIGSAVSIMETYRHILSAEITTGEAINRLLCLRLEYQAQGSGNGE